MTTNYLYHGSRIQNLRILSPQNAGYNEVLVCATTEKAFAAIFINRKGSLLASWGRINKIPYYCERKPRIFNECYKNQKSSIYILLESDFYCDKKRWIEERVSKNTVNVIYEIKINDIANYLLTLDKQGNLKIIF